MMAWPCDVHITFYSMVWNKVCKLDTLLKTSLGISSAQQCLKCSNKIDIAMVLPEMVHIPTIDKILFYKRRG